MGGQSFSIERAGEWLLRSGIFEASGGMARYYRTDQESRARISLEITGYAVSCFVYLGALTGRDEYREAAIRAATFLIERGWDDTNQVFPFEYARPGEEPCRHSYFFDSGIMARGLLALWRATGEGRFLDAAHRAGQSMLRRFVAEGRIHPIVELPGCRPVPPQARWAGQGGCYQLKAALAWYELHEAGGEQEFLDAWEDCLDAALRGHESFLPGEADERKVMDRLHAYCYFLEGLLPVLNRQPCARAMAEGVERVSHFLRQIAAEFERSDVWAQLLRLRLLASRLGAAPLSQFRAEQEAAAVTGFQLTDADPAIDGGVCFGRAEGVWMPFVNPVSTSFGLQSMAMWAKRGEAEARTNWRELI